jgi:hypothetical protein
MGTRKRDEDIMAQLVGLGMKRCIDPFKAKK